jgi:hypothetical protein
MDRLIRTNGKEWRILLLFLNFALNLCGFSVTTIISLISRKTAHWMLLRKSSRHGADRSPDVCRMLVISTT